MDDRSYNQRAFERFSLPPMYSPITVQRGHGGPAQVLRGHAYDISEGGARVELDEALDADESIEIVVSLPGSSRAFKATAQVAWVAEADDDPGPRRVGFQFDGFATPTDRDALLEYLGSGFLRRAA